MKHTKNCLIFIGILVLFSSCLSNKNYVGGKLISGPDATAIVNYVNQGLISIAELERRSLESYASVTGENATTDQKLLETLRDFVVPTYTRFVTGLKNIPIENQDVRQVNAIYIKAAESRLEGFKTIMIGLENNDLDIIQQGNKMLQEGSAGIEKWRAALKELYKKNGIAELKEK